jgi:hypothetical protein
MGDVIMFPEKRTPTPFIIEDLWIQLEIAERRVEDIKRILGILATEGGIE